MLVIETHKPMPLHDVMMRTEVNDYRYLYIKEIRMTEPLSSIRNQLEQIDFASLFREEQEFNGRKLCSLEISWGDYLGVSLKVFGIDACTNREVVCLHELMKKLFAEIRMEDWYVINKK
jgi:hypothetical protein